ncbi:MAG: VanZ family protein [Spirochaetaceae bacterium]
MIKTLRIIPLLLVCSVIIYLSLTSRSINPISLNNIDKVYHFIAYFTLGFTICLAFSNKVLLIINLFLGLALGIALEFIQGTLGYRDMSVADAVANSLGLFTGVLVFYICYKQIYWVFKKLRLNRIFLDK